MKPPFVAALLLLPIVAIAAGPNIVLINADDLGYGDLGAYGHPVIETPNLDRLAAEGMVFTHFYAPSALCSPSRAGLLTGRIPYRTGIRSWIPGDSGIYLRDAEVTLAELLKQVGYQTALIGKWHLNSDLGAEDEPQPNDQGFDYFYGHNAYQIPTNRNPVNIYRNRIALGEQTGYTADLYANEAIDWITAVADDGAFFLYLAMAEPHTTIENPPEQNARYARFTNGDVVPIPSGLPDIPIDKLVARGPGEYYANVTYMDQEIGRVLQTIDALGLRERTVVVFTSDNGPVTSNWHQWHEVNAHGSTGGLRGRKHLLYEGGIRVPTMIRAPGRIEPGSRSAVPAVAMDLFVTLATIAGADIPTDRPIDGADLSPVLDGGDLPSRPLFWALDSIGESAYALQFDGWKLLLDRELEPLELFDLNADPLELNNQMRSELQKVRELMSHVQKLVKSISADPLRPDFLSVELQDAKP